MMKRFGKVLSQAQVAEAQSFADAGLCSFSLALSIFGEAFSRFSTPAQRRAAEDRLVDWRDQVHLLALCGCKTLAEYENAAIDDLLAL